MLFEKRSEEERKEYIEMLASVGALSRLSSESSTPYIGYRHAEKIFCSAFNAKDLSRSDCSADASLNEVGIGIKTFINGNGKTLQKIAEFNSDAILYRGKTPKEVIEIISHLRNERIKATQRIHGLDKMIYHCIVRDEGKLLVYEKPMDEINIKAIKKMDISKKNTISFEDGINEYTFNISKSTLYKRFVTEAILLDLDIKIIDNPFEVLRSLIEKSAIDLKFTRISKDKEHIFLPLFSDKGGRNVPERSGLNQWNAKGRMRDYNEVYIPIPAWIHREFEDFFPSRDVQFDLILPDGQKLTSKVCQDGGKALMSNPNLALGKWLLRKVLDLKEGELLTYDRLMELNLDSVVIYKEDESTYSINFTETGSYDEFSNEYKV